MPTSITYAVAGSAILCAIARDLIRAGHDPATLVTWTRRGVPISSPDKPLNWWAERRLKEDSSTSARLVKVTAGDWLKSRPRPARDARLAPSPLPPYPKPPHAAPGAAPCGVEGAQ
ncbi:MAG: hypothetical protein U1E17_00020 [Geminicoccaceae bacterium]